MRVRAEKTVQKQEQKPLSSKKKYGGQSAFQLFDQRNAASRQQHFQRAANNSPQAQNLDSLQQMANGKENHLFHAIATASAPGTLDDISVSDGNQPGEPTKDLGATSQPQNAVAPAFQVQLVPANRHNTRFRALITKTQDAYEGDVTSMYVKSGTYYTNYRWIPDEEITDPIMNEPSNRLTHTNARPRSIDWDHVYLNVSSSIASLSKSAEQEHLSDIREAYRISLGAIDQAIDAVVSQTPQNGYAPTGSEGYKNMKSAKNDTFNRINELLPDGPRGNISSNQTTWLNEYLRLAQMTQHRDRDGWHTFVLQKSGFWQNNKVIKAITEAWDIYAEHPETKVQYLDSVKGPNVHINQVPSNAVVHY